MSRSYPVPLVVTVVTLLVVLSASACRVPPPPPPVTDVRWAQVDLPPFAEDEPAAADCATPTSCLVLSRRGALAHWDGAVWVAVPLPPTWTVHDVSCPRERVCLLGGERQPSGEALLVGWDGRDLREGRTGTLVEQELAGPGVRRLSCPDLLYCMLSRPGSGDGSIGSWDGWGFTPLPFPAAPDQVVTALDCGSASSCVAATRQGIASWNGIAWTWSPARGSVSGSRSVTAVACAGAQFCVAIGDETESGTGLPRRTRAVAATWSATGSSAPSWSAFAPLSAPPPAGTTRDDAYPGLACAEPQWCVAIGAETSGGVRREATRVWTGAGWAVAPAVPDGTLAPYTLACSGGRSCLAVGAHAAWTFSAT